MVAHICNTNTQEAVESVVPGQAGVLSEFQANLGYLVRPYFNTKQMKDETAILKSQTKTVLSLLSFYQLVISV